MKDSIKNKLIPLSIFLVIILALGIAGALVWEAFDKDPIEIPKDLSGVNIANEYHSTTTEPMTDVLIKAAETFQLIKTGQSTIGSIIVSSTTGHTLEIINATSTRAKAIADGTSIIKLATSTPVGSYIFDVAMSAGLVVKMEAKFGGIYVITFR